MRTSNPALNANVFARERSFASGETMTLQGTVNKTLVLLALAFMTASWIWGKLMQPAPLLGGWESPVAQQQARVMPWVMGGMFGGLIAGFVTVFKRNIAGITAPIYALCEGLVLGGVSAIFEMRYPGIVIQAVALTFGTLFCLLMAYKSGMIRVTDNLRLGIVAATGAIAMVYFFSWILSFFGVPMTFLYGSGPVSIGFSLLVVGIAAFNLVLDFDFIEQGVSMGVPKYMEWYGAFGLMVTLVWLYMEILRLLAKMRERR